MTETRADRLRREHAEVTRTLDGLTKEIELADAGKPPSPERVAAEEVTVSIYRSWDNAQRASFDARHPTYAIVLKESWIKQLAAEQR